MSAMTSPRVVLVSGDLLLGSRLRAALDHGSELVVARDHQVPAADTVFIDLNQEVEERLAMIADLRRRGVTRVIGFCQHDAREVRIRAMAQGADEVVTNGSLPQAAQRLTGALPRG